MLKTETVQDRFYGSIAPYYSGIFPFKPEQLDFILKESGNLEGKNVLDVGCGTGDLALALAGKGATVTAIDLNDAFLAEARNYRNHDRITYRKVNMLHITRFFGRARFDGVICFGNTLVHLLNPMQMRDFFSGVRTVLKPGCPFFLQILNYDYIFQDKIDTLPTLENDLTLFERKYIFLPGTREIRFSTRLTIKDSGEIIDNETDLLGIGMNELVQLMDIAGLTEIKLFADFHKTPFGGKHLPLVCLSHKAS